MIRMLGKEGVFAASSWVNGTEIPWARSMREIRDRYAPGPMDDGLDEETWLEPRRGAEVLEEAGFENVRVQTEEFEGRFDSPDEALAWSLAWPVGAAKISQLDRKARESFLEEARQAVARCDLAWRFAFHFYVAERPAVRGLPVEGSARD